MTRIREALGEATRTLKAAGIEAAALEARLLMAHACGTTREDLIMNDGGELAGDARDRLEAFIAQRIRGEPIAYLTGTREFYGRSFRVTPDVLIPRPDSETLIDAALAAFPDRDAALTILDLGVGSGALLLTALCAFRNATGLGIDRSIAALAVARGNADALGLSARVRFACGDWMAALAAPFDLVLANPPYIEDRAIAGLARDVRDFEPRVALDGGGDGLAAYRAIAPRLGDHLDPDGLAIFECGADQPQALKGIFAAEGLLVAGPINDLSGRPRSVVAASVANKPFLTLKKTLGV
ncbi:MAG: peptide chain release factor N(5)-glutamine methyltransferase [Alphaproteobacteria bacterium]|nr:peptide chain release factor N(5)-glutamine methyltransferase [Alphaproteobacteria bacterium]